MEVKDRLLTALRKIPPMMWLMIVTLAVLLAVGGTWFDQFMAYHENYRNLGLIFVALLGAPLLVWRAFIADTQSKAAKTQAEAEYKQALTAEANHIASTYTQAIEQLAATTSNREPALELRLGGIYALEKIAQSNAHYHPQVMEVLSAYLRMHSPLTQDRKDYEDFPELSPPRIDIQAIMTVIGRRNHRFDTQSIDLSKLDLDGLKLRDANLTNTVLSKTSLYSSDLSGTDLSNVDLTHALLSLSTLTKVNLHRARLLQAVLNGAILNEAQLSSANLMKASLSHCTLDGAELNQARLHFALLEDSSLIEARLSQANLNHANLNRANFMGANLRKANLRKVSAHETCFLGADLTGAQVRREDLRTAELDDDLVANIVAEQVREQS